MNSTTYLTPFWIKDESGTSANFTVNILNDGQSDTPQLTIYYSTDATTWSLFGNTVSGGTLSKNFSAGSKIYLSCTTNSWAKTTSTSSTAAANNNRIGASKNFSVGGNIMSLIYGTTFADNRKYTTFPDDSIAGIFGGLFYNQSIINAGELVLPVTHSTSPLPASGTPLTGPLYGCYRRMFENCASLVNGPHIDLRDRGSLDLPYCFQRMFAGCTSLMSLHINTVGANYRYNSMFNNNGGAQGGICYDYSGGPTSSAFPSQRWTRQNVISMYLPTYDRVIDWHSNYSGYVNQVDDNQSRVIWKKSVEPQPQYNVPFWVECSRQINLTLRKYETASGGTVVQPNVTVYYSTDMINWTLWGTTSYSRDLTLPVDANTRYYFKSTNDSWSKRKSVSDYKFHRFEPEYRILPDTPKWTIGGNVLSLIYGDDYQNYSTLKNEQYSSFCGLTRFYDTDARYLALPLTCTQDYEYYEALQYCRYAPLLPSTVLTKYCYYGMFAGSEFLLAPELPVTTLADHCYGLMFRGCTSLTTAPELPATTLVSSCYTRMFDGCTSLNKVKCLATDISAAYCTYDWLTNVSSTGTFTKAAGVTWPTGSDGIPSGWTVVSAQ